MIPPDLDEGDEMRSRTPPASCSCGSPCGCSGKRACAGSSAPRRRWASAPSRSPTSSPAASPRPTLAAPWSRSGWSVPTDLPFRALRKEQRRRRELDGRRDPLRRRDRRRITRKRSTETSDRGGTGRARAPPGRVARPHGAQPPVHRRPLRPRPDPSPATRRGQADPRGPPLRGRLLAREHLRQGGPQAFDPEMDDEQFFAMHRGENPVIAITDDVGTEYFPSGGGTAGGVRVSHSSQGSPRHHRRRPASCGSRRTTRSSNSALLRAPGHRDRCPGRNRRRTPSGSPAPRRPRRPRRSSR